MKVHQVVVTVIDFDDLGAEGVRCQMLESMSEAYTSMSPIVRSVKTVDIGEWSDDNPLNRHATTEDELRRLFGPV